jgi:hypothetical protein
LSTPVDNLWTTSAHAYSHEEKRPMAYEMELLEANDLRRQLARLARQIVTDFEDGKLTAEERRRLIWPVLQFGMSLILTLQAGDSSTARQGLLYVLEHAEYVLPASPPPEPGGAESPAG